VSEAAPPSAPSATVAAHGPGRKTPVLALAALGVVFGDIGTSPLYALKECFTGTHAVPLSPENVLGVLSLVFWSLNFLISFKYLGYMMRADNRGEGGILALLALLRPADVSTTRKWLLISIGLFGSTMLYGDGVITPAISVLGAVEGLTVAAPDLERWVVWISVMIILALFWIQKRGTATVGAIFGPVTSVWFICIAMLGVKGILLDPSVLRALNPWYAIEFFIRDGAAAFFLLASVVLVVTGGEALYADMGHFGKRPIRLAWTTIVLPALVLNYFGQGALLLSRPEAVSNPFYELVPRWALLPMIVVATGAAVTASQALISGSFSLTQQAMQLGYVPRLRIVHTSSSQRGQIYIPAVNRILMVTCVLLVLAFRNTTNLAGTYGVAVTGTMATTTVLFCGVARDRFGWSWPKTVAFGTMLLVVELAFFLSNLTKVPHGGWVPLLIGAVIFVLMSTWRRGRNLLSSKLREGSLPLDLFVQDLDRKNPLRIPGTAVFMTSDLSGVPPVMLHHLKHNKVLHERVILLSIDTLLDPQAAPEDRLGITELRPDFLTVAARFGFMETPDVPAIFERLAERGFRLKLTDTTFYLGRETLIPTRRRGESWRELVFRRMPMWRKQLFVVMANNARSATAFFNIPANRVVEMGAQIQI
jgi:KUP system potassium uptake protein